MVDSCHYFSRTHSERCALDARRRGALAALAGWALAPRSPSSGCTDEGRNVAHLARRPRVCARADEAKNRELRCVGQFVGGRCGTTLNVPAWSTGRSGGSLRIFTRFARSGPSRAFRLLRPPT